MQVVVVDQKGPKVLGFFALATEIHDDSGAPHTLEHLCFMGSKTYPYKGVLDKLATRAYSGTNAWTATDHTAYTLESAGWKGFAQVLPIYLEHVIAPTLTDSGCYTEVHHIDGSGHDAGVCYSEMQGVQNNQGEIMELRSKRLTYKEGVGFRYETGGMMEQLRVLTADRIRQFHREMYQPKNLCIVIVGEVDRPDLLSLLDGFEDTILGDIPKPDTPFKRPWIDSKQASPLEKSITDTVEFPEEDESTGEILITFLGPDCNDVLQMGALAVLLTYLAGSSASVLENTLVEKEQISSAVYYSQESRPNTVIQFTLSSVDSTKLAEVEARFFEVMKDVAGKPLEMTYLTDCITREIRRQKFYAENSDSFFTSAIISRFLFGPRDGSALRTMASLAEYEELKLWTDLEWKGFLKKWIADAPHISILGKPSSALSKKIKDEEEARIAAQRARLGEAGLKALERRLAAAKAENDREIPRGLLEKFEVPNTQSIHFIQTMTARAGSARDQFGPTNNRIQRIIDQDTPQSAVPFLHFEHIPTSFVFINVLLGTASIPVHLRPLLSIYLSNFFDTPIMRNGKRLEFEKVVIDLERDTAEYDIESGSSLGNPEVLRLSIQVESEKYETAISWIKDLFWHSIFDLTRIKATTTKLLADVPDEKRDGSSMMYSAAIMTNAAKESITRSRDTLVKALYLKRIKEQLNSTDEGAQVISQLEQIRHEICQVSNLRVLVVANMEKLPRPVASWQSLGRPDKPLPPLDTRLDRMSEAGRNPGNIAYVIPLSAIDSSYLLSTAKGPTDLKDSRTAALMVAISYLDATEGPLWMAVRGTGLAYGTGFSRSVHSGQVSFNVYRAPDAGKAYAASKSVIDNFISGTTTFDNLALEGAISHIILGFANGQATMATAAMDSFVKQVVRGLPADWNDTILKEIRNVTVDEIKTVMEEILLPLFVAQTANVFVTCAPIMQEVCE